MVQVLPERNHDARRRQPRRNVRPVYSDAGDNVYANRNFLGLYSPNGGSRTLRLPGKSRVVDLLENKVLADGVTEMPLNLARNQSVLFKVEASEKR